MLKKDTGLKVHPDLLDNISLVPFRFKYLQALKSMLEEQNCDIVANVTMKTLPKIGYLAMLNGYPLAAGFLRQVEGKIGQIDGLTSNPNFGSLARHKAINLIVCTLIEDAKRLKLQGLLAFTNDASIIERGSTYGFKQLQHTVIAMKLT